MAGMLPGVESARRRRFHKSGGCLDAPLLAPHNSTRRSSFCLYASNHESRISSSSSLVCALFSPCLQLSPLNFPFSFYNCSWGCINLLSWFEFKQQRGLLYQAHLDESLGGAAREAKQRLDDKFRAQRVSETNRYIWAKFSNFFHGWLDVMMIPEGWNSDLIREILFFSILFLKTCTQLQCGGEKKKLRRVGDRDIWVKEKWFKEVQLEQIELEGLRARGLCSVFGNIQEWGDTDSSSLCPQVPFQMLEALVGK